MKKVLKTLVITLALLFLFGCEEETTTKEIHLVVLYNNDETINQQHTINHGDSFSLPMLHTDEEHIYVGWSDGETVYSGEVIVTENLELTLVQEVASEVFDLGEKPLPDDLDIEIDYVAIFGYSGNALYLRIPQYINDLPVKVIRTEAFKDSEIIEIYIPNNLTTIDYFAFEGCEALKKVEFYGELLEIGDAVVNAEELNTVLSEYSDVCTIISEDEDGIITYSEGCPYITSQLIDSVIINDIEYNAYLVTYYMSTFPEKSHFVINKSAFKDCVSLETFYFPKTGMFVFFEAFYNNPKLTNIVLPEDDETFKIVDGVIYSYDESRLIFYPGGLTSTEFTIPETVTDIHILAFTHNTYLEKIYIPENTEGISSSALYDLPALTDIFVDENNETFFDIDGVLCMDYPDVYLVKYPQNKPATQYTIPDLVDTVGSYAFYKNKNLETIDLSDITSIQSLAFMSVEKLTVLDVPNTVEFLGILMADDSSITTIVIRRSIVTDLSITNVWGYIVRDKTAITLYLPDDSMDEYYEINYWNYYHEVIRPLSEYVE